MSKKTKDKNVTTLNEHVAALAGDEQVMRAVGILAENGINGVIFEKLITLRNKEAKK